MAETGANVAAVTAVLGADTEQFTKGFDRAEQKSAGLEKRIAEVERAIKEMGAEGLQAAHEMAEGIAQISEHAHEAAEGAHEMHEAMGADIGRRTIRETIALLKELGEAMTEAVKETNPEEYDRWQESVAQVKDALNEVWGSLGERLLPVLETVLGWVTNFIDLWSSLSETTKDVIAAFVGVVAVLTSAAAGFAYLAETAELLAPIFVEALPEVIALLAPVLAVGAAVAGVILIAHELKKAWDADLGGVQELVRSAVDKIKSFFGELWEGIKSYFASIRDGWAEIISGMIGAAGKVLGFLQEHGFFKGVHLDTQSMQADVEKARSSLNAANIGNGIVHGAEAAADALKSGADAVGGVLAGAGKELKDAFKDLGLGDIFGASKHRHVETDADKKRAEDARKEAEEIAKINAEHDKQQEKLFAEWRAELAKEAQEKERAALTAAMIEERSALNAAGVRRKGAEDAEKIASEAAKKAEKELAEARKSGGISDVKDAQAALDKAFGNVQAAAASVVNADTAQLDTIAAEIKKWQDAAAGLGQSSETYKKAHEAIAKLEDERLRKQEELQKDQHDLERIRAENTERLAKQNAAAATYYKGIGQGLAEKAGGSATGIVQAGMQGFAAGGPVGAAVGAGVGLLEQSASFKKLQDAISKITQDLADTIGVVLEPIIGVVKQLGGALKPLFDALKPILELLGEHTAHIIEHAIRPIMLLAEPVGKLLVSLTPLFQIFEQVADVLALLDPPMLVLIAGIEAFSWVVDHTQQKLNQFVKWVEGLWDGLLGFVEGLVNKIASVLPDDFGGNALRELAQGIDGMKFGTQELAKATDAAVTALDEGAKSVTAAQKKLIETKIKQLQQQAQLERELGYKSAAADDTARAKQLQDELDHTAAFGSSLDLAQRNLDVLQKQAKSAADALKQMTQSADQRTAASSSKVSGDVNQVRYLQQAIADAQNQHASPAVVKQLQDELKALQAQSQIDQLQLNVDIAAAALAHDDAQAQLDAINEQKDLARVALDYQRGLKDSDQEVKDAYAAYGSDSQAYATDSAKALQDSQDLTKAQSALLIGQAKATLMNTMATNGNTSAMNAMSASLLNVPAMFKVARATNEVLGAQSAAGAGSSTGSGAGTHGAIGARLGANDHLSQRINKVLENGTYQEVVINGGVHFHDDGSSTTWDDIKKRLKQDKQHRSGTSSRDLVNRWLLRDAG